MLYDSLLQKLMELNDSQIERKIEIDRQIDGLMDRWRPTWLVLAVDSEVK